MSEPIDELYFDWLCAKVITNDHSYDGLLSVLYKTEFIFVVSGDDNRAADGLELRSDFLAETNVLIDNLWFEAPPSVLEVLIRFAQVANFETDIPVAEWFWKFIENLGLNEHRRISDAQVPEIQEILRRFLWRTYDHNGNGGLFPMHEAPRDQRRVEIWYQFCDYVQDQRLI